MYASEDDMQIIIEKFYQKQTNDLRPPKNLTTCTLVNANVFHLKKNKIKKHACIEKAERKHMRGESNQAYLFL